MTQSPTTPTPTVTFIAAEDVANSANENGQPTHALIQREPWEKRLSEIAQSKSQTFRVPRNEAVKRAQVVDAVLDTFELIGGTPRMSLWANENLGDFYKIYAKLAPRQLETENKHDGQVKIVHVLPRGKLDE